MNNMLISVVIPAFNAESYLAEALDSIFAQDRQPHEVIVVDDGSTDNTAGIAKSYPDVRYIHQRNQGQPTARNQGLAHATGELISFLDADDMWLPNKSSIQLKYLAAHPEKVCVMSRAQNFLQPGVPQPKWVTDAMLGETFNAYSLGTLLAHRSVFEKVGNFNPTILGSGETEWFVRLVEAGITVGILSEVLLRRRIHANNVSADTASQVHNRLLILKEVIDRKRARSVQLSSSLT